MRIISGIFKGKKLLIPSKTTTRPLKDIVKESIFNLLKHSKKFNINLENASVLDLFSGSGSFGLECLSREVKEVVFIEKHSEVVDILKKNLELLKNVQNFKIIKDDCFKFFEENKKIDMKFDIIFIDPPYKEKKLNLIIDRIKKNKFTNDNGVIIIHRNKKDNLKISESIDILETRYYGISKIYFCI